MTKRHRAGSRSWKAEIAEEPEDLKASKKTGSYPACHQQMGCSAAHRREREKENRNNSYSLDLRKVDKPDCLLLILPKTDSVARKPFKEQSISSRWCHLSYSNSFLLKQLMSQLVRKVKKQQQNSNCQIARE